MANAEEVRSFLLTELSDLADLPVEQLSPEATLQGLDIDSLDLVELGQIVAERYNVKLKRNDFKDVTTIGAALDVITARCVESVPA